MQKKSFFALLIITSNVGMSRFRKWRKFVKKSASYFAFINDSNGRRRVRSEVEAFTIRYAKKKSKGAITVLIRQVKKSKGFFKIGKSCCCLRHILGHHSSWFYLLFFYWLLGIFLDIIPIDFTYYSLSQKVAITLEDFIAQIGGLLGLWLGISGLSIVR